MVREVARTGDLPMTCTVQRPNYGEPRYLAQAARLALVAAKLPAAQMWLYADEEGSSEREADEEFEDQYGLAAEADHPPVGDCSLVSGNGADLAGLAVETSGVSLFRDGSCDEHFNLDGVLKNAASRPVQQAESDEFSPSEGSGRLTRSQRKARQRLLERKMAERKLRKAK